MRDTLHGTITYGLGDQMGKRGLECLIAPIFNVLRLVLLESMVCVVFQMKLTYFTELSWLDSSFAIPDFNWTGNCGSFLSDQSQRTFRKHFQSGEPCSLDQLASRLDKSTFQVNITELGFSRDNSWSRQNILVALIAIEVIIQAFRCEWDCALVTIDQSLLVCLPWVSDLFRSWWGCDETNEKIPRAAILLGLSTLTKANSTDWCSTIIGALNNGTLMRMSIGCGLLIK